MKWKMYNNNSNNDFLVAMIILAWTLGLAILVYCNVYRHAKIEEQSIYHIYDKLEIYRVVHEAYPVVIITTNAYRLKNGTRELILYRQDTCEPNKVDSIKYEHSKKINEQINKVLNESL